MKKCIISMVLLLALFIIANCSKANDNVCMFRGNLERTGVYNTDGPKELPEIKWKFKTGGSSSFPVVCGGVVYFGSCDGNFYAIDTKTGQEKWKFEAEYRDEIISSPTISDGVVYFGSCNSCFYAIDTKTGQEKWKFETEDEINNSSPQVYDNVV